MQKTFEDGESLARCFKYHQQKYIRNKKQIPYSMIRATVFYRKNKNIFDNLLKILVKYSIDIDDYIEFFVDTFGSKDIDMILSVKSIESYANNLKKNEQYKKICEYYIKSANNIADSCIRNGWKSSLDYIRDSIVNNRIAYDYISGKVSKYYIASIQNFKKIYTRLNQQNKDELSIIYNASEELLRDVQDAFMKMEGRMVKPISFTDAIIEKTTNNRKQITEN